MPALLGRVVQGTIDLSVHEMKNYCCLFERIFTVQLNGVFFVRYLFSL